MNTIVYCAQCHRETKARKVTNHLDGKSKLVCSNCRSTNIRPIAFVVNGEHLPQMSLTAQEAKEEWEKLG